MVHYSSWDGSTVTLLALDSFVSNTCSVLALKASIVASSCRYLSSFKSRYT